MDSSNITLLGGIVDRLGAIKAAIAELKAEEASLKQALVDSGQLFVDGTGYRAAISHIDRRPVIDWRAVAERLNPSRQLVVAHTSYSDAFTTVRVSARRTA